MPWLEVSIMTSGGILFGCEGKKEPTEGELCRRFGIHPDTGYKWL